MLSIVLENALPLPLVKIAADAIAAGKILLSLVAELKARIMSEYSGYLRC